MKRDRKGNPIFVPLEFHSEKHTMAELKYDVRELEMMAIVKACRKWHDTHQSLQWAQAEDAVSRVQRWFLARDRSTRLLTGSAVAISMTIRPLTSTDASSSANSSRTRNHADERLVGCERQTMARGAYNKEYHTGLHG